MPAIYTQVRAFCRLAGHYWRIIKGFTNIVHPLYDVLGKEVKMGPVGSTRRGMGGCGYPEKEGPVCACPGVPRF